MLSRKTLAIAALASGLSLISSAAVAEKRKVPGEFEELAIILEVNETDGDAEIVLRLKADEGIQRLTVDDPSSRKILNVAARDREQIGIAQLRVESAEPNIDNVIAAYPEGEYRVHARTVSGKTLLGVVSLSHQLLPAPAFKVDPASAVVSWPEVPGAAGYIVEVEQDDLGVNLTTTLTPNFVSFAIPPGFLTPGVEYQVGVATISENGNIAVAESSFVAGN